MLISRSGIIIRSSFPLVMAYIKKMLALNESNTGIASSCLLYTTFAYHNQLVVRNTSCLHNKVVYSLRSIVDTGVTLAM